MKLWPSKDEELLNLWKHHLPPMVSHLAEHFHVTSRLSCKISPLCGWWCPHPLNQPCYLYKDRQESTSVYYFSRFSIGLRCGSWAVEWRPRADYFDWAFSLRRKFRLIWSRDVHFPTGRTLCLSPLHSELTDGVHYHQYCRLQQDLDYNRICLERP